MPSERAACDMLPFASSIAASMYCNSMPARVAARLNAGLDSISRAMATEALPATASPAGLAWAIVEKVRDGHFTNLGVASGVVAGLVAITPGCGFVTTMSAVAIGMIAGAVCSFAVSIKFKFGFDDALDVVGVHFVGGR